MKILDHTLNTTVLLSNNYRQFMLSKACNGHEKIKMMS